MTGRPLPAAPTVVGRHAITTPEHMRAASRELGARAQGRFDLRDGRILVHVSLGPSIRALPHYLARGRPDRGIVAIPDEGKFDVEVIVSESDRVELREVTLSEMG